MAVLELRGANRQAIAVLALQGRCILWPGMSKDALEVWPQKALWNPRVRGWRCCDDSAAGVRVLRENKSSLLFWAVYQSA